MIRKGKRHRFRTLTSRRNPNILPHLGLGTNRFFQGARHKAIRFADRTDAMTHGAGFSRSEERKNWDRAYSPPREEGWPRQRPAGGVRASPTGRSHQEKSSLAPKHHCERP